MVCVCMLSHFSGIQLCVTPMHCNPPGSSVYGILQAIILKWVVKLSSRGSSWLGHWNHISQLSCIGRQVLFHQHHLGSQSLWYVQLFSFYRQENWCWKRLSNLTKFTHPISYFRIQQMSPRYRFQVQKVRCLQLHVLCRHMPANLFSHVG